MILDVCLHVIGIAGAFCFPDAEPIGRCSYLPNAIYCNATEDELFVRASWYNPLFGGTNCAPPCHLTGNGTAVEDCFDSCIACPIEWIGRRLNFGDYGVWTCNDTGGAIRPGYGRIYSQWGWRESWYITLDFMSRDAPDFAYFLLELQEW